MQVKLTTAQTALRTVSVSVSAVSLSVSVALALGLLPSLTKRKSRFLFWFTVLSQYLHRQ